YAAKLKENNTRISQVLEANWSLIDVEDVEPFSAFLADCARMQVEVDEKHGEGASFYVNQHLGSISYIRPEFVERVTTRWNAKRKRLDEILRPRWWTWLRRQGSQEFDVR